MNNNLKLLNAGIIAGPFFLVVAVVQAFMREGFDWIRHPASLLSLGDLGWIQIANFILTGALYIICAFGLRKILTTGIGSRSISLLFIIFGAALISGGVFKADPSLGFPPGTPPGIPNSISWHSALHGFAPIIGFLALVIALIVLGRRFGAQGQKGWKWASIIIGLTTFVLSALPNATMDKVAQQFNFLPLWAAVALGFGFTSMVLMKLKKESNVNITL